MALHYDKFIKFRCVKSCKSQKNINHILWSIYRTYYENTKQSLLSMVKATDIGGGTSTSLGPNGFSEGMILKT